MPDDFDSRGISGHELNQALHGLEEILGREMVELLSESIIKSGIDLADNNKNYTLKQLRPVLDSIFNEDAADLIMRQIRKELEKTS